MKPAPRRLRIPGAWLGVLALVIGPGAGGAAELRVPDPGALGAIAKGSRPGDVLLLPEGTWNDVELRFQAEGTEAAPITLRAAVPGTAVFTGDSRLRVAGTHLVVEGLWFRNPLAGSVIELRTGTATHARHCRITGCAVTRDEGGPAPSEGSKWISLYGSGNRVDHCRFAGKANRGATLVVWLGFDPEGGHRIDHNGFGPRPPLDSNDGETIRIGDSATSLRGATCVVEDNLFDRCDGETEIISNKSCDNTYRRNTFLECQGALTLRHGHRCLVESNYFLANHRKLTGGIRIIGDEHRVVNNYLFGCEGDDMRCALTLMNGIPDTPLDGYAQVRRALVAFNTLVECKNSIRIGQRGDGDAALAPRDCVIANNVVWSPRRTLVEIATEPVGLEWSGNIMRGRALGIPAPRGIREVDPRLVRAGDGLWRPAGNSPALGAADTAATRVAEDIDGQPRGLGADAGCDQRSDAPARYRPRGRSDVGPEWWE